MACSARRGASAEIPPRKIQGRAAQKAENGTRAPKYPRTPRRAAHVIPDRIPDAIHAGLRRPA